MNASQSYMNLVQKALACIDLENFADALRLAHITAILKSGGPFTVFAPVNTAFLDMPASVLKLVEEEHVFLGTILQYHLVSGLYSAADLSRRGRVQSLIGEDVSIFNDNGNIILNDAKVLRSDLKASNGVIHVIDRLLLPSGLVSKDMHPLLVHC